MIRRILHAPLLCKPLFSAGFLLLLIISHFSIKNTFTAISAIIFLAGCTKTIDVKLRSVPPLIVLKGNITNLAGPYYITINQTVPFDAPNTYPPVSGAQVIVLDSNDHVFDIFTEDLPGRYTSHNLAGKIGHNTSFQ